MPDLSGAETGQAYVRACRTLLDPASPGDALTAYYLLTHPESRSRRFLLREVAPGHVVVEPGGAGRLEVEPVGDRSRGQGQAVLAICDTGPRDHPLVVLRAGRPELVPDLIVRALPRGLKHYFITRPSYRSALDGVLTGVGDQMETVLWRPGPTTRRMAAALPGAGEAVAYGGGSARLETYAENGRLGQRLVAGGSVVSSATILWESDRFAEVGVSTAAAYRRRGYARVVVGTLILSVLDRGLTPLYIADKRNLPSLALAASLGLAPTGHEEYACSGSVPARDL